MNMKSYIILLTTLFCFISSGYCEDYMVKDWFCIGRIFLYGKFKFKASVQNFSYWHKFTSGFMVSKAAAAKQYHVKGLVLYRAHFPIWLCKK